MKQSTKRMMLKVALLCIALDEVASGATTPAMYGLVEHFTPEFSVTLVQMISSIPHGAIIFAAPLFSFLCDKFKKKHLIVFALGCFIIGGTTPYFCDNLYLILAFRLILGIGSGIMIPMLLYLIDCFFEGPEKQQMIGWNQAAQMVGGTFFQMAGGFLAAISWNACFLAYLFPIWMIPVAIFFVPEPAKRLPANLARAVELDNEFKQNNLCEVSTADAPKAVKEPMPKSIFFTFLGYFVFQACYFTMITNISIFVEGNGFGTSAFTGTAMSIMTICASIAGIVFGQIFKKVNIMIQPLGVGIVVVGFTMMYFATSMGIVFVCCAVFGFGMGLSMPSFQSRAIMLSPPTRVSLALGYNCCAMGLGNILQPVIFNDIIGVSVGQDCIGAATIGLFCLFLVLLIANGISLKRSEAKQAVSERID